MKIAEDDLPAGTQRVMNVVQQAHDKLVAEIIDQADAVDEILLRQVN